MLWLGWWELYFMLKCFNVYLEWLRASQPYALFPENYKTTQLDNKLCQSTRGCPWVSFSECGSPSLTQDLLKEVGKALKNSHLVYQPKRIFSRTSREIPPPSTCHALDLWRIMWIQLLRVGPPSKQEGTIQSGPKSQLTDWGPRLSHWNVTHFKL